MVCPTCKGQPNDFEQERTTDYLPGPLWRSLRVMINPTGGQILTYPVYTVTDYGRAYRGLTGQKELIDGVHEYRSCQASKIVGPDLRVCSCVGIFMYPNGYDVQAVFLIKKGVLVWTPE